MKSPLKPLHNSLASGYLRNKVGQKQIVDSFFFFDGNYECMLAQQNNFVIGHTTAYTVGEFWTSLEESRPWIEGVCEDVSNILHKPVFELLQDTWHTQDTLFIRSALFFLLSRCSTKGLPSSGELLTEGLSPMAFKYLRELKTENLHFIHHSESDPIDVIQPSRANSIILMNLGSYGHGLTQGPVNLGVEETFIDHRNVREKLFSMKNPWIVNYTYSNAVTDLYRSQDVVLLDMYGNKTQEKSEAREVVIANF